MLQRRRAPGPGRGGGGERRDWRQRERGERREHALGWTHRPEDSAGRRRLAPVWYLLSDGGDTLNGGGGAAGAGARLLHARARRPRADRSAGRSPALRARAGGV